MRNDSAKIAPKFPERVVSAAAISPDVRPVNAIIRARYCPLRYAAEYLARAAGVTPRTARNWLDDRNEPNAANLLALYANDEQFAAEFDRLLQETKCQRNGQ